MTSAQPGISTGETARRSEGRDALQLVVIKVIWGDTYELYDSM